ncbi:MAG: ankyrin repeat domain-containing protein [Spirochaetota bacterium]
MLEARLGRKSFYYYDGIIEKLIDRTTQTNSIDHYGNTPLHYAMRRSYDKSVKALSEKGLGLNQKNVQGNTALNYALRLCNHKYFKILLEKGITLNYTNHDGLTPLYQAVNCSNIELVNIMLKRGVHPNNKLYDRYGDHPFTLSIKKRRLDIAKLLFKYGADINVQSASGWNGLMLASYNGDISTVQWLLEKYAKLNSKVEWTDGQYDGATALTIAVFHNHTDIVKLLLKHGADPQTKCDRGMTPYDYAVQKKNPEMIQLLRSAEKSNIWQISP